LARGGRRGPTRNDTGALGRRPERDDRPRDHARGQHREAHLRALLPPEQFRLVWALRDAEERHGQAERLLVIRGLADELSQELPEHAAVIRAAVGRLLGEGTEVGEVA